jgi:hypothetical protein
MKQKYIVAIIAALLGLLLFATSVVFSAPMAQTATPTAVPAYVIDTGNYRVITITQVGVGTSYEDVSWANADYPTATTRLIGFYIVADASDYLENFTGGVYGSGLLAPPYIYNNIGAELVARQRVTLSLDDHEDAWSYYTTDNSPYPSFGTCNTISIAAFFPGYPCDNSFTHNNPYSGTTPNVWSDMRFRFYASTTDPYGVGNPLDEGTPQVTIEYTVYPLIMLIDGATLPTSTPTPTPTAGTPGYATQLPFPTEYCITATTGAATPTPYYDGSPTPTPTGTLVTPTPTGTFIAPTATVTSTAGAPDIYVSDVFKFPTSLSPWTKTSVFLFPPPVGASWSTEHGPDDISGTVRLTYNEISHPVTSTVAPAGGIVWTRGSNIPSPLYVKVSVKSDTVYAGSYNYLVLHTKDVRGFWAVADAQMIGTGWREITFYTADFAPYSAIGFAAYSCNSPSWHTCNPVSYSAGTLAGALVDNIQILAGSYANTLATRPCPETGSDNEYRICRLYVTTIDVYAACRPPEDWLNVGGWLSWLRCRIEKYFAFDQIVNGAQLQSMYTFGYTQEPLGSAADFAILIQEGRDSFEQARAEQPGTFTVPDMDVFFSTGGLEPIVLTVPGHDDDYLIQCPPQFNTVNEGIRKGLCFSIYAVKTQPASYVFIQALNWLANLAAFIFLLQTVRVSVQSASM